MKNNNNEINNPSTPNYFFNMSFSLNNKHLCISSLHNKTNQYYTSNYTIEELITLNTNFTKFSSINDIYTTLIKHIELNYKDISITYTNNTFTFQIENLFHNETVSFILYNTLIQHKTFTIKNNKIISTNSNPFNIIYFTNEDNSKSTTYNNYSFESTYILIFQFILSLILIVLLSLLCSRMLMSFNIIVSSSIATKNEMNLISNWINPKHSFKYTLLYKASIDGDSAKSFHSKCDEQGPTLTLVQSVDGWRFGGYSEVKWKHSYDAIYVRHSNIFIFSLNLGKKYSPKNQIAEIFSVISKGPTFGYGHDFSVNDKCFTQESSCFAPVSFTGLDDRNEFCGGKQRFMAKEVEVFLVEIEHK